MSQDVISQLLAAVLNFSDLYDQFSLVCFEIGMVCLLVDMTKELQDAIPHNVKYVVGIYLTRAFSIKQLALTSCSYTEDVWLFSLFKKKMSNAYTSCFNPSLTNAPIYM